jgi:hypothetical protein
MNGAAMVATGVKHDVAAGLLATGHGCAQLPGTEPCPQSMIGKTNWKLSAGLRTP